MYQIFKDIYNNYKRCEFNIIPLTANTNMVSCIGDICSKIYSKHRKMEDIEKKEHKEDMKYMEEEGMPRDNIELSM